MTFVLEQAPVFETWVAGQPIRPLPLTISPQRFEAKQRTSNLTMRVYRCFVAEGYPNVLTKINLSVQWKLVHPETTRDHLTAVANMGQPCEVALFKQETDFFDGDGTTQDFTLQRLVLGPTWKTAALAAIPGAFLDRPEYALRVTMYDVPFGTLGATETVITGANVVYKTSSNIDTSDPSSGEVWIEEDGHDSDDLGTRVTKIRFGDVPAEGHDTVRVTYIPLMRMILDSDAGRSFETPNQMGRSFRFTEQ